MNDLIAISQNLVNTKNELNFVGANARGLHPAGHELMPIKADMLGLPDDVTAAVLEACAFLFAAILQHEDALLRIRRAPDAVALVRARMDRGQAEGTVSALFHGSTRSLLVLACERAPIAFYAMAQAAPKLRLIEQLKTRSAR